MDPTEAYDRAAELDRIALYFAQRSQQDIHDLGVETEYSRMLRQMSQDRARMATELRRQAANPPKPWELLDKVRRLQDGS